MVNHFYYFLYKKSFDSCDPHLKKRNFIMFYCWWEHLPKLINSQWIKAAVKVSPFPVKISQIKKSGKWSWLDMIAPAIPSVWCGVVWACVNAFNQNTKIAGSGFFFLGYFLQDFLNFWLLENTMCWNWFPQTELFCTYPMIYLEDMHDFVLLAKKLCLFDQRPYLWVRRTFKYQDFP